MSELPKAWSVTPLSQVGRWLSGGTPATSVPSYWGGYIPWISAASLTSFNIRDSARRITDVGARHGTKLVDAGAVLFVVRGMSLKSEFRVGIARQRVAFGQDCKAILPSDKFDAVFVAYAVKAATPDILRMVDEAGHGTGRLQTDLLEKLPIPTPSLREQRWIAEVLGSLDDKIDSNGRLAVLTEGLAVEVVNEVDRLSCPLGELARLNRRQTTPAEFRGRIVRHYSLPAFDASRLPEQINGQAIKSAKFRLEVPSVLVSKLNPHIPRVWNAAVDPKLWCLASTEFLVLEPKDVTTEELWAACAARTFNQSMRERVTGTTGSHQRVRPNETLGLSVVDPRAMSTKSRALTNALVATATAVRRESLTLTALRDTLLPRLISGELRVRDAEALVGSVL